MPGIIKALKRDLAQQPVLLLVSVADAILVTIFRRVFSFQVPEGKILES